MKNSPIEFQTTVGNSLVTVGRFTYGFNKVHLLEWGEGAKLSIGSFCSLARGITIYLGGNHRTDWATTYPFGHIFQKELGGNSIKGHPTTKGNITIGNDVWIGTGVSIMSGITIGNGAVIAANSNVVKNVAPYEIVGGNPAQHLKFRFSDTIIDLLLDLKWWDLPVDHIREIAPVLSQPPTVDLLNNLIKRYKK
jgi:acetyltransferase-like isoleucine patch superfamily enzyme